MQDKSTRHKTKNNPIKNNDESQRENMNDSTEYQRHSASDSSSVGLLIPTSVHLKAQSKNRRSTIRAWENIFRNRSKTNIPLEHGKPLTYIQTRLKPPAISVMSNRNIGDSIPNHSEDETIIFHNINGLKDENNWHQILQTMQDLNADIFGMVEINRSLQNQL
jgi:hypothetical protein